MSSMAGDGVNIGGYRMRVSVRPHTFSASRGNLSGMMLRSHSRRETPTQVSNGTIRPETIRETRSRRFRSNITSSSLDQHYANSMARSIDIGIQSLIRGRRERTDTTIDLYDLEVRADALEVLRSSLVLTLRSTGDVRVWLNILRQYRGGFISTQNRNGIFKNLPYVDINEEDVQCSICLRDFKIGDKARSLPCDHKFHSACIRPWLKRASTCPMCRHLLLPVQPRQAPTLILPVRRSTPATRHR